MKRAFLFLSLMMILSVFALAQDAKTEPTPTPQPKALTPEQVQRLLLAEKDFKLAQSQLREASLILENLTVNFALELGVDIKVYAPKIEVINPQLGQIGFLPKPAPTEPEKPEAKRADVPKLEKEQK